MMKTLLHRIYLSLHVMFFCVTASTVYAGDMPPSWPWKGVVINNLTFTPEKLVELKASLPHLNSIRLTLLPRQTAERKKLSPDETWRDMSAWTQKMLDACAKEGVVAIISIHQFPVDPQKGMDETSPKFWSNPSEVNSTLAYVERMTKEFAPRGNELAAFEILSEPTLRVDSSPTLPKEWQGLILRIISAIRKNSDKWIVITPGLGGMPSEYANFKPLGDRRIVYGAHMYVPFSFTLQGIGNSKMGSEYPGRIGWGNWNKEALAISMKPMEDFAQKYQVPIWIGEFSAAIWAKGSNQYLADLIDISNTNSWGWSYFSMDDYTAWNPDFEALNPSQDTSVKNVGHNSTRWHLLEQVLGTH